MPVNIIRSNFLKMKGILKCVFGSGLLMILPVKALAGEYPSMAFLEYLGSEETEIDGELSGPVDMDLERYLVAKKTISYDSDNNEVGNKVSKNAEDNSAEDYPNE